MSWRYLLVQALLLNGFLFTCVHATDADPFKIVPKKEPTSSGNCLSFSIAYSPDGKMVAASHASNFVSLWNQHGHLIKEFMVSTACITGLVFDSPETLVVKETSYGIKRIDLKTQAIIHEFKLPTVDYHWATTLEMSPDGTMVVAGRDNGDIEVWDYHASRLISRKPAHEGWVTFIGFRNDGSFISASHSGPNALKLWGPEAQEYPSPASLGKIDAHAISPDGRVLATICDGGCPGTHRDCLGVKLLDPDFNVLRSTFIPIDEHRFSRTPLVTFSPDGKTLAILAPEADKAFLFNVEDMAHIATTNIPASTYSDMLAGMEFSPDSKYLAIAVYLKKIEKIKTTLVGGNLSTNAAIIGTFGIVVLDVAEGVIARVIKPASDPPLNADFSPDGTQIITSHFYRSLKLWAVAGNIIKSLDYEKGLKSDIGFGNDGSSITDRGRAFVIKDLYGNSRVFAQEYFDPVALSPDGKLIATYDSEHNESTQRWNRWIEIQDTKSGKKIDKIPLESERWLQTIFFDKTGKYIVYPEGVWDVLDKSWLHKIKNTAHVTYSPDLGTIAALATDKVQVYSFSGKLLSKIPIQGLLSQFLIIKLNEAGDALAVPLASGDIQIWDPATAKMIKTLRGHISKVRILNFSRDGKYLVSAAEDRTMRLWNLVNGQSVAMISSGADWFAYTPDGYFDASPHGGELAAMVKGLEAYGVDQFAARYNRPDLILERMGTGSPEQITHYNTQYQKRLKRLGLTEADLGAELHVPDAKITRTTRNGKSLDIDFSLSDDKHMLKRYNIFVNNVPVFGPTGKEIGGNTFSGAETIELSAGTNKIELSAMNKAGAESYRALTYAEYDDKEKRNLYYLAFGVSQYKDSTLNLNYADKDTKDLETAVLRMRPAYANVYTKILVNSEVTTENIVKAKAFFKNASVDDTVVLFLAGHGGYSKGKEPKYYYMPYEADPDRLADTGVDFDTIEDLLNDIKPRKKLFLLDTCESGELEEDVYAKYYTLANARGLKPRTSRKPVKARGQTTEKGRGYLLEKDRFIFNDLARRSGAVVFSSSRGNEISYESSAIQNGFFSKEIINALTNKTADKDSNGKISADELKAFVSDAVAKDTADLQHPTIDRDNLSQKIEFPLLP